MNKGQHRTKAQFDILQRIREERDKRSWTDYQLAENSDIPASTISTWTNKNIEPGVASIEKICCGLGISLSEFFNVNDNYTVLTEEQKAFLDCIAKLNPQQRESIINMLKSFTEE